jgi:outer membrane protein assembly factor BamB/predicted negative regulator of RcsB-dependent stress response
VLRPIVASLLAAAACTAAAAAQQQGVKVQMQVQLGAVAPAGGGQAPASEDGGVAVDLQENPNLDRFLRRANQCVERGDFATAIQLLQDVVEGRSEAAVTDIAPPAAAGVPPKGDGSNAGKDTGKNTGNATGNDAGGDDATTAAKNAARIRQLLPGGAGEPPPPPADPRHAVFSQDGRLYRPVRRLCHELLARLPAEGRALYRATYEVAAAELLQQALDDGGLSALEQVQNRFFATLPGGRALLLLGDRLMHDGRHRAALLAYRDLLSIYPVELRAELGVKPEWLRFKIAVCMQRAGEPAAARREVAVLADEQPDAMLRVEGELQAAKDLALDARFAGDGAPAAGRFAGPTPALFAGGLDQGLLPLWQFRFRNPEPYKDPKSEREQPMFLSDGSTTAAMPYASRYGPATHVVFAAGSDGDGAPRALFPEHFRLRAADATSGLLTASTEAPDEPPPARENRPRVRIAASDFALLRPVDDGQRCYLVLGSRRNLSASTEVLRASELVAYRRGDLAVAWSSEQWRDGADGYREVVFLAAPTVFGERLLLPSLRRGRYALECLDAATGKPLWHVLLHGGGTPFFKAPGCPVVVQGGAALVATNAGCVANVDALTGELRWLRRYERVDPRRGSAKARKPETDGGPFGGNWAGSFRQDELTGFHPNDLLVHGGVGILAPVDGDVLLGLDLASGDVAWMFDATSRFARFGRLRTLVGIAGDELFALSDTHLVAFGASGGLLKWAVELPKTTVPKAQGRGRGAIAGDCVLVPAGREVLAYGCDGALRARLALPPFGASREPLGGSVQLTVDGPWLAVGYQGGVEVFSTVSALRALATAATAPRARADLLARIGDADAAVATLAQALAAATDPQQRRGLGDDLLELLVEQAAARAAAGDLPGALALFDARADALRDRPLRLRWHLARLELCRARGDLAAQEREQGRLYACMEGNE